MKIFFENDIVQALWWGHDTYTRGMSFVESDILKEALNELDDKVRDDIYKNFYKVNCGQRTGQILPLS